MRFIDSVAFLVKIISSAPALTKDEFTDIVSHEVMRGVLNISASSAVASFVDVLAEADPKELDRLSRLIEKKKKELGKGT